MPVELNPFAALEGSLLVNWPQIKDRDPANIKQWGVVNGKWNFLLY